MSEDNLGPFVTGIHEGRLVGEVSVDGRLRMVKRFKRHDCLRALDMKDLQATVRKAVERRLRQLDKGPMDYDPNLTTSGRMAKQRVRLTFALWQYRHTVEVEVGGNCTGLDVIECAVGNVYDGLPSNTEIVLTDQEGETLGCRDDDLEGEDWLKDMLIAAEIISIQPQERNDD